MMDVSALNEQFAIQGQLIFREGPEGIILAEIQTQLATATISLQGAQVLNWAPLNEAPVIWLSQDAKFTPEKSIRGGVPVCWPWFGPHATEPRYPGHGYARTTVWDVVQAESLDDGRIQLAFALQENDQTRAQWPHNTPLQCRITVGNTLEIELQTTNKDDSTITITEALHTYFNIGDIRKIQIHGLEDTEYLDKVDGGQRKLQHGPVTIGSEVDRIYVETRAECIIDDPVLQRKILINKLGSNSTVVWNPWLEKANKMGDLGEDGYRHMVCVESGNAAENTITIIPGESHQMVVTYRIERSD